MSRHRKPSRTRCDDQAHPTSSPPQHLQAATDRSCRRARRATAWAGPGYRMADRARRLPGGQLGRFARDPGDAPIVKPDLGIVGPLHRPDRENCVIVVSRSHGSVAVNPAVPVDAVHSIGRHGAPARNVTL